MRGVSTSLWSFVSLRSRGLSSFLALLPFLLGGCGAATGGSAVEGATPGAGPPGATGTDGRFVKRVTPFPVLDPGGVPYDHPFLGGFDVPRPQFVDIDGDGDLDLFVQERSDRIIFFENTGARGEPEYVWRTDAWRGLEVGEWSRFTDLDGDGDPDLLAEQPFSYIRYYRNVGSATEPELVLAADSVKRPDGTPIFSDRQNIPSVADVDCDGVPDLFLGRADGTVARYEMVPGSAADGDPRFRLVAERFEDIEIVAQIGGQAAGQPDGPDRLDGQDRPDRPDGQDGLPPSSRHGANSMAFADVDGDGDPDLLWGDFFEPSVLLMENTGSCGSPNLRSEPRPLRTVPSDSLLTSGYNAPVPVDLNADGDMDLVVGVLGGAFNTNRNSSDNILHWERTDGGAYRRVTSRFLDGIDVGSETTVATGDLDGDGDVDVLVGNKIAPGGVGARSWIYRFENRGTPTAPRLQLVDTLRPGDSYHYAPVLHDVDGDGDLDLVAGTWNDDVLLFENTGSATGPRFEPTGSPLVVLTRGSNSTPALGDVDGDGLPDLFVGEASGELNYFRNAGSPGSPDFELVSDEFQEIDVGRRSHPSLVDWDGDGDLDLVVGREDGGAALWLNDGTGVFTGAGDVLPDLPPYGSPTWVDLDGDGDLDVLSGDLSGGVVFLENRGG